MTDALLLPLEPEPAPAPRWPAVPRARSSAAVWGARFLVLVLAAGAAGALFGFARAVIALTVLGFAGATLGWPRPAAALLGIGLLCTLDPLTRTVVLSGGWLRWNTLNYLLVLAILVSIPRLLRLASLSARLLCLLLAFLAAGLLWSSGPMDGLQHILGAVAFFGLLVFFLRASRDPGIWFWMAAVNGAAGAVVGLLYFAGGDSAVGTGLEINPNAWAYFPLTALFSICLSAAASPRAGRLVLSILSVVNFGWVFLTGSRGSLVIAAVCMAFLAVRLSGAAPRMAILAAAVLCAALLSGLFGSRESYAFSRLGKLFDSEESLTQRTSGRSDLARAAWQMFLDHPALGMGTGGFASRWSHLQEGEGISSFGYGREMQAHSAWMKTLAENGLAGVLLLGAFVLSFAVSGWRNRASGLFLPGLLITAVLALALVSTEFQSKGLWFLSAGGVTLLRGRRPEQRTR